MSEADDSRAKQGRSSRAAGKGTFRTFLPGALATVAATGVAVTLVNRRRASNAERLTPSSQPFAPTLNPDSATAPTELPATESAPSTPTKPAKGPATVPAADAAVAKVPAEKPAADKPATKTPLKPTTAKAPSPKTSLKPTAAKAPTAKTPPAKAPTVTPPAAEKPEAHKPEAKKLEVKKPEPKKPEPKKADAKTPAATPSADKVRAAGAGDRAKEQDRNDDDEAAVSTASAAVGTRTDQVSHPESGDEKAAPAKVGNRKQRQGWRHRATTRGALAASLLSMLAIAVVMVSGIAPATFTIASASSSDSPIQMPPAIATIIEEPAPDCNVLKCVALTFDDGPDRYSTTALLDILEARGVKANFFVLGTLIQGNEDIILRMQRLGMGVENHTWDHPNLGAMSHAGVIDQLQRTNQELARVLGYTPKYIRPPYGSWTPGVTPTHGMRPVMWEVDPQDWLYRSSPTVTQNVVSGASAGDVILLHDIHQTSVDAVPGIIDSLHNQGFTFVTLDDLYAARPNCPVELYCAPASPVTGVSATATAPMVVSPSPVLPNS
ncbi:polysaccharide deacetylase family protein [Dietzia aerolata]|uniref:Polysaccharide deacetylase family protein n=2 Tax=Dietzia aerolata TaxID=595984 RepID=A0ABV5JQ10_9ACTN|nr:polysaccharide deacetylase family protein [Dietzia aerolata]